MMCVVTPHYPRGRTKVAKIMNGWVGGQMGHEWIEGWTNGQTDGQMDGLNELFLERGQWIIFEPQAVLCLVIPAP